MCPLLSQGQQGGAVVDIIRMQQLQTPPQWQFLFHTGAGTTPICRSPFSERLFRPIYQSRKPPIFKTSLFVNPVCKLGSLFLDSRVVAFEDGVY